MRLQSVSSQLVEGNAMYEVLGNAYKFEDGYLMTAAILRDGTVDAEWIEVTDFTETPAWLVVIADKHALRRALEAA
jgi:hypothetical protein